MTLPSYSFMSYILILLKLFFYANLPYLVAIQRRRLLLKLLKEDLENGAGRCYSSALFVVLKERSLFDS